ncbi:MAG: diguanylate cyclase/phosphodiesterase (GGDEF & EAL domains) with PAS/PAC sensor(s) [Firmicutes bacterium]|nr:diguanylate cyclase/phosphodiesterase (GGDEF & EAL domains) with PAS/PAC sensor(s) [Bacillota bacterium]
MYRAKEQGRNNYQLYDPTMNVKASERMAMENNLRHVLEREEFVVCCQPQVNISTGEITGVEALVRWQHPDLGQLSPVEFIPLAEESGLIIPIGEWVPRTVCAQNKAWQKAGYPPVRVAVNLSVRQFQQQNLVETVARVLKETGLEPHYLVLEITESIAMQNADFTIVMLRKLEEMGIHISIDDFGTGYSSLSYLKDFPLDTLKIGQSFVRDLTTNPNNAAIVTAIITMAHSMKLKVVAEGVEAQEQLVFLKQQQCDEIQGYLFSKPLPTEAFEKILAQEVSRANLFSNRLNI